MTRTALVARSLATMHCYSWPATVGGSAKRVGRGRPTHLSDNGDATLIGLRHVFEPAGARLGPEPSASRRKVVLVSPLPESFFPSIQDLARVLPDAPGLEG